MNGKVFIVFTSFVVDLIIVRHAYSQVNGSVRIFDHLSQYWRFAQPGKWRPKLSIYLE